MPRTKPKVACKELAGPRRRRGNRRVFLSVVHRNGLGKTLRKTESASAQQGREQPLRPGSSLETALSKKLSGSPSLLRRQRRRPDFRSSSSTAASTTPSLRRATFTRFDGSLGAGGGGAGQREMAPPG